MDSLESLGRLLVIAGIIFIVVGVLLMSYRHIPPIIGKLPGDILIERKNFSFYFPIATSILVSIILSVILYFFTRK